MLFLECTSGLVWNYRMNPTIQPSSPTNGRIRCNHDVKKQSFYPNPSLGTKFAPTACSEAWNRAWFLSKKSITFPSPKYVHIQPEPSQSFCMSNSHGNLTASPIHSFNKNPPIAFAMTTEKPQGADGEKLKVQQNQGLGQKLLDVNI